MVSREKIIIIIKSQSADAVGVTAAKGSWDSVGCGHSVLQNGKWNNRGAHNCGDDGLPFARPGSVVIAPHVGKCRKISDIPPTERRGGYLNISLLTPTAAQHSSCC